MHELVLPPEGNGALVCEMDPVDQQAVHMDAESVEAD